jgi:hypothetical protein
VRTRVLATRIVAAAIKVNGEVWTLPPPARHGHLVHAWCEAHGSANIITEGHHAYDRDQVRWKVAELGDHEQGFMTSAGAFVDRKRAAVIARSAGQIAVSVGELFAEDLW